MISFKSENDPEPHTTNPTTQTKPNHHHVILPAHKTSPFCLVINLDNFLKLKEKTVCNLLCLGFEVSSNLPIFSPSKVYHTHSWVKMLPFNLCIFIYETD